MRKLLLSSILIVVAALVFAQTPNQFKYQAVLRNADGTIMVEENVTIIISILKSDLTTSVFDETHTIATSSQGLINLNIGSKEDLSAINWTLDEYFIKVSVNGTVIGTSQLLSVPYALHAKTVENLTETDPEFTAWDKDYTDLTNLPTIPSNVSELTNDAGYLNQDTTLDETEVDAMVANNGYLVSVGLDDAYNIGNTITTDAGPFTVAGTDGIISTGTLDSGSDLTISGEGTRLIWYPKKGAFRAGNVYGPVWDDVNIGYNSAAFGNTTRASGKSSTAMGYGTSASGDYSTAMGYSTTASGYNSIAMGDFTKASGDYSTAMGYSTKAFGERSIAMGSYIAVEGEYSVGIGLNFAAHTVAQDNTLAIMGGFVKIATSHHDANYELSVPDIYVEGTVNANNLSERSDRHLKQNIHPLENGLQKVMQLQGVSFQWKESAINEDGIVNGNNIGVIAQEIEEVLPELVNTDSNGYKSVQYSKISAVLIEAVKELKEQKDKEIEELQEIITELSQRIETLENK